ncbi:MAG: hypothetical protein JST00_06350 [Deltaproteobacteria bacterium]|nr:hypothetical protein [Deltaproteobacteria bacterium]
MRTRVSASPSQIAKWAQAYGRWAELHGFARDAVRTDVYRGERAGKRVRFLTGVDDDGILKSPELEIELATPSAFPAVVLTVGAPPPPADIAGRAVVAVLEREGVVQIDVTRRLVRLSFAPMTDPALFDPALDELLRALSPAADSPYR